MVAVVLLRTCYGTADTIDSATLFRQLLVQPQIPAHLFRLGQPRSHVPRASQHKHQHTPRPRQSHRPGRSVVKTREEKHLKKPHRRRPWFPNKPTTLATNQELQQKRTIAVAQQSRARCTTSSLGAERARSTSNETEQGQAPRQTTGVAPHSDQSCGRTAPSDRRPRSQQSHHPTASTSHSSSPPHYQLLSHQQYLQEV